MSDILQNAQAYDGTNTTRVDTPGMNNGQAIVDKPGVVGFDCSGFYDHVMKESGYDTGTRTGVEGYKSRTDVIQNVDPLDVRPGDTVIFDKHIGVGDS